MKVLESIYTAMVLNIKDNGVMTSNMGKAKKYGQMEQNM
jgi:hypothetical protein